MRRKTALVENKRWKNEDNEFRGKLEKYIYKILRENNIEKTRRILSKKEERDENKMKKQIWGKYCEKKKEKTLREKKYIFCPNPEVNKQL